MKHTPGPWITIASQAGRTFGIFEKNDNPLEVNSIARCEFRANNEANARLIASSPELLQALIDATRSLAALTAAIETNTVDQADRDLARESWLKASDVITKATGGDR